MKSVFSSWTVWFGVGQILLAILGLVSGQMGMTEAVTLLTTGIGTIGLRFKTTEPIGFAPQG